MDFDELQNAWQAQDCEPQLTISSSALLKEIQRNRRYFEGLVFWRDVREVGMSVLVAIVFTYFGASSWDGDKVWSWYIAAALVLGVGVFMVVDRIRQKRRLPVSSDSLIACVECSLMQVNHQIWLLKNVFWWYLLPPGIGVFLVIGQYAWIVFNAIGLSLGLATFLYVLAAFLIAIGFCIAVDYGVYRLNQFAVRKELLPRKEELEALRDSLTASED